MFCETTRVERRANRIDRRRSTQPPATGAWDRPTLCLPFSAHPLAVTFVYPRLSAIRKEGEGESALVLAANIITRGVGAVPPTLVSSRFISPRMSLPCISLPHSPASSLLRQPRTRFRSDCTQLGTCDTCGTTYTAPTATDRSAHASLH